MAVWKPLRDLDAGPQVYWRGKSCREDETKVALWYFVSVYFTRVMTRVSGAIVGLGLSLSPFPFLCRRVSLTLESRNVEPFMIMINTQISLISRWLLFSLSIFFRCPLLFIAIINWILNEWMKPVFCPCLINSPLIVPVARQQRLFVYKHKVSSTIAWEYSGDCFFFWLQK